MSHYLFITTDYKPNPGGIAAYIDNIAKGLRSLRTDVTVLVVLHPRDEQRMAFLKNYADWVVPFPSVQDEKPQNWIGRKYVSLLEIMRCVSPTARSVLDKTPYFRASTLSCFRLMELLAKDKPTMVVLGHLDMRFYPFVLSLLENRVPYGMIAHDCEVHPRRRLNDAVRRGMILKGASWIVANSRHTESLLKMWGLSSEKIIILHPPLSQEAMKESFQPFPRPADGKFNMITICRLVRSKGIDITLRALKILERRGVPCEFTIAGDGPERESLEALACELGLNNRVHFLGYVQEEEKWSFMRQADVFVMPSRVNVRDSHEGFGLAFIEAAAVGLPAVGSRAGGIPEAVLHGETGLLVSPESPEDLAEALMRLYQNPETRNEMGRSGMRRAMSQFSPVIIAARFEREVSYRLS